MVASSLRAGLIVLVSLMLVACGAPQAVAPTVVPPTAVPTCAEEAASFIQTVNTTLPAWDDAVKLAGNTPRINLASQIERLQELRRDLEGAAAPACAARVKETLINSMKGTIQGYLDFAAQESDLLVQVTLDGAASELEVGKQGLAQLASGAGQSPAVTLAMIQSVFPEMTFEQRKLRDETTIQSGRSRNGEITIEVYGPSDNLSRVTLTMTSRRTDEDAETKPQQTMLKLYDVLTPDWTDRVTWVPANITKNLGETPSIIPLGSRILTAHRLALGVEDSYITSLYLF